MSASADRDLFSRSSPGRERRGDGARALGDLWQWLGIGGAASGTNGEAWRAWIYVYIGSAITGGAMCVINVITTHHEAPRSGLSGPIIWEASSWLSCALFYWIAWVAFRVAPLVSASRWKLLVHIPAALLFSLAHVEGFVMIRELIYALGGARYEFGAFVPNFRYEFSKDVFTYALFVAALTLVGRQFRRPAAIDSPAPATFDIRDGAKLTRVRLDQILAVASAGNYVEFALGDGRKLLMRSSLAAVENELGPRGFVRTHRSWLVNAEQVTGLKPEGSGDYTVELGSLTVSLSRRFPEALAKLRGDRDGVPPVTALPRQVQARRVSTLCARRPSEPGPSPAPPRES